MASNFFNFENNTDMLTGVLTVRALNEYVESLLSGDSFLRNISIEGEISGLKKYLSSGHTYFTLKDGDAAIKCVLFKGYSNYLTFQPDNGMRVIITGDVSLYVRDGSYQFYAKNILSVGDGELYARFLELKARLSEAGMFDEAYKKPLPFLPRAIGIATSREGAVLHDIMSVTERRFPNMDIVHYHCSVQGAEAPLEIVEAIKALDNSGLVDVIIVGRGGGSMEDLNCFNDERVANAIFACKTPIISAVGHETDFTIADFVADVRAATPSAGAELAVPVYDDLVDSIDYYNSNMSELIEYRLSDLKNRLSLANSSLKSPMDLVELRKQELANEFLQIDSAFEKRLLQAKSDFNGLVNVINALSPLNAFNRGFALVTNEAGNTIRSAKELNEADKAIVTFSDGSVTVIPFKNN